MPKIAPNSPLYPRFRKDFPAQAGEGIPGDLNYSDTIVPIIDMTSAAGTGVLPQDLQTAWDFSTGNATTASVSPLTVISTPGFWQVDLMWVGIVTSTVGGINSVSIYDGSTDKRVWIMDNTTSTTGDKEAIAENKFVVYLRSGDVLRAQVYNAAARLSLWYRQIADINGNLINPQGFTFG